MKVQICQCNFTIGDLKGNQDKIIKALERAKNNGAEIVLFSELALTGYPPEDLLLGPSFIEQVEKTFKEIVPFTKGLFVVLGLPRKNPYGQEKPLYNSAAILMNGEVIGFKDKTLLPTYDVFDEARFFEPGKGEPVFVFKGKKIGITICEDAWQHAGFVEDTDYRTDPILELKKESLDLMLNLSASPYAFQRKQVRLQVFQKVAKSLQCPVAVCNQVGANDALIFDGYSFFIDAQGNVVDEVSGFVEQDLLIDTQQRKKKEIVFEDIADLYSALVLGVRDYFYKQGFTRAILGLSGGIDSALVACIAKEALGASNVLALALPSRFSSKASFQDATHLVTNLGIPLQQVSIEPLFKESLASLRPLFAGSLLELTEENLQARIRGMILMAFSNQSGALLLNTSNKSEMAMGYSTLYGDLCGGLAVLSDVTKLRVYELARYLNREKEMIPHAILQKPPSAELREGQTDEQSLPPYQLLDRVIEAHLEHGLSFQEIARKLGQPEGEVQAILQKLYRAEYKRRQAPIGLRVTSKSFGWGRNVPVVQSFI